MIKIPALICVSVGKENIKIGGKGFKTG